MIRRPDRRIDLLQNLPEVGARVRSAKRVCLFLDVSAEAVNDMHEPLSHLAARDRFAVTLIDSCSLDELKRAAQLSPRVTYVGNDGLDIEGPGLRFTEQSAGQSREALKEIAGTLRSESRMMPGVRVHDRGLTLSVHTNGNHAEVSNLVGQIVPPDDRTFLIEVGAHFVEVRPRVAWTKGLAAQWLVAASGTPDALPIYISDDPRDEDAFACMKAGITIQAGNSSQCFAQYRVADHAGVGAFLSWLAGR